LKVDRFLIAQIVALSIQIAPDNIMRNCKAFERK